MSKHDLLLLQNFPVAYKDLATADGLT